MKKDKLFILLGIAWTTLDAAYQNNAATVGTPSCAVVGTPDI